MTYGGTSEAGRLRALLDPALAQMTESRSFTAEEMAAAFPVTSPTFHYEHEPLPDGTTIVWPVLDGPLPPAVIGDADDDWDEGYD